MADLPYIQQRQEIAITGQDSTGNQVNYVSADANGNLFVKDYASGSASAGTAATVSLLIGGLYNSTLPTLTTGQQAALQTDSNARLLTNVAVSALPTGAATSANQTSEIGFLTTIANSIGAAGTGITEPTGGSGSLGWLSGIYENTASALNDTTITGTITAVNGVVTVNAEGAYTITVSISGTWVGTIIAEAQFADSTWNQIPYYIVSTALPFPSVVSASGNGYALLTGGGYLNVRLRATAWTSGTANIALDASIAQQSVYSAQMGTWTVGLSAGSNVIGAVTQSGTWSTGRTWTLASGTDSVTVAPLTNSSVVKAQLQDNAGNAGVILASQLQVRDVLNVGFQGRAQSVTTTAAEALGGATILANRKTLSITPTNGIIYWGPSGVTTTTGTPLLPNNTLFLDVTDNVHVYVIAAATTDTRIAEFS